jgi:AcrR family transcriptional regulator
MNAPERLRLPVDERRKKLLALGRALFSERTYEAISIEEIARAAGISKGLLYHYFPSKRDFYVACVRASAEELLERTERGGAPADFATLMDKLDAYLDYVDESFQAYALLLRSGVGSDAEVLAIVESTRAALVTRLIEALGLDEPAPLVRTALWGWIGFVESASLDWIAHRDLEREPLRRLLAETLLAVLASAGATRPS